jgi:hypothetical protein
MRSGTSFGTNLPGWKPVGGGSERLPSDPRPYLLRLYHWSMAWSRTHSTIAFGFGKLKAL